MTFVAGYKPALATDGLNWDATASGGNAALTYMPPSGTPHIDVVPLPANQRLKRFGISTYIDGAPRNTSFNVGIYEITGADSATLLWDGEMPHVGAVNTGQIFTYLDVDVDASAWAGKRLGVGIVRTRDGLATPYRYHTDLADASLYANGLGSVVDLPTTWFGGYKAYAASVWAEFEDAQSFTAPLLINEQIFFGATISPGVVNFTAPLLANSQTFFGAQLTPGIANFTAPLLANVQTFFAATVVPGNVNFTAPLLTNTQTFFAGQITNGVTHFSAPLLINSQIFYGGQITGGLQIDWFQNFSLTTFYKTADRRVKAAAEDRKISAVPLDRTIKFRF